VRCPKCDQSQAGNAVRESWCFQQATGVLCVACGTTADRSRICLMGIDVSRLAHASAFSKSAQLKPPPEWTPDRTNSIACGLCSGAWKARWSTYWLEWQMTG